MLKISQDTVGDATVFRLEGQIAGPWVAELRRVFRERQSAGASPITLDLAAITFIDSGGLGLLEDICHDVVFVNCSLFAAEQLREVILRQQVLRS